MKIGAYEVSSYNHGNFRLDGGSMFGVVPRPLWRKLCPPDEKNRILLSTRSLVLRTDERLILIDTGNGTKWNEKLRGIFCIEEPPSPLPFKAEEVTDLILTHLHFDHAGGVTFIDQDDSLKLTYPNATHYLQRTNFENAKNPSPREKASYLLENVAPLENSNLKLIDGTIELFPGITVHPADGHTVGQQCIEIADEDKMLFFATDLVPTSHHLPVPYNMGYDICASRLLEEKERFLQMVLERGGIVVFEHDPEVPAAKIEKNAKGHFCVRKVVDI
jgi:glyoxylase-like metal-dependent hydrolase (beta-lactamase superfamily II)